MEPLSEFVSWALRETGFEVVETHEIAGRPQRLTHLPRRLDIGVRHQILRAYPDGVYDHQAEAIAAVLNGDDVCLATSTASGKSLVFMAAAAHFVRTAPRAKVLALYPARALIQDQIGKWRHLLEPLNIKLGYIDGGVPTDCRSPVLDSSDVVLMTPDVAHAWFMSHLDDPAVARFRTSLCLVVLDEAHVYDGVFGTNMAYLVRRLQVAAGPFQIILSTATLGKPHEFFLRLTGRHGIVFDADKDASPAPCKRVVLARECRGKDFESKIELLAALAAHSDGRFLAFCDSRKAVEQFVAALRRGKDGADTSDRTDNGCQSASAESSPASSQSERVFPYRAGYETEDRNRIQAALAAGELTGVVSTSALELGLDIGEVDIVLFLTFPPSVTSFWQRVGRCGRVRPGVCVLIDDKGMLLQSQRGLRGYLDRPLEPNWLYLDNRYIQYANALCAAAESRQLRRGTTGARAYRTLPQTFLDMLDNEIDPQHPVDHDLYLLKQQAEAGPHYVFPLRSGVEKNFDIVEGTGPVYGERLGTVTLSQALREAYPGAIYYYMARPYRVVRFDYGKGTIHVKRERHWTTQPVGQTMVFPQFGDGILSLWQSKNGFVAETNMQVSERVTGFVEKRGGNRLTHEYGAGSPYYQRPLTRFFQTTGVCWKVLGLSDEQALTSAILQVFCLEFGIQERDLGSGMFYSQQSPLGAGKCRGTCIFDATHGSLRLTQRLADNFPAIVDRLSAVLREFEPQAAMLADLETMRTTVKDMQRLDMSGTASTSPKPTTADWIEVIARGEEAMLQSSLGVNPVRIIGYRFTPQGLVYDLEPPSDGTRRYAPAQAVQPIYGQTKMVWFNLITGEESDCRPPEGA